ncbi:chromate transporter [Caballeronia sp. LZ025]|uniref:chromate transporter n=1 Tax=Caballeronia TaxID=1827195 RepID=UPI001FD4AFCD|nr:MULTISPECIES: chromate transporter [Caballeronia]MDR5734016.1 chromate transporter [Caballeronia sp. LZ025]
MTSRLFALFSVFAPLSLATIGGGQTVIADMQRQVVDVHHWMTNAQFLSDFAIARMAPGPGSLLATLIGWQVAGFCGAVISTVGLFCPTAVLMYGVVRLWDRHRGARWLTALENGLRPVAAGMIAAAIYVLFDALDGGWLARAIAIVSTILVITTRLHALVLVAGGAAIFLLLHLAIGVA